MMMRTTVLILSGFLAFALVHSLHAQFHGYGSVGIKITPMSEATGIEFGLEGGMLVDRKYEIGIALYDLLNGVSVSSADQTMSGKTIRTKMHYGGLMLGMRSNSERPWGWTAKTLIGIGDVAKFTDKKSDDFDWSWHWIVQPIMGVHFSIAEKWIVENIISYKFVFRQETSKYKDILEGSGLGLSLKYVTL